VAINNALPLMTAQRDAIRGFECELQTNPMLFHLDSLLIPLRACAMDWRRNRIFWVCKNCSSLKPFVKQSSWNFGTM